MADFALLESQKLISRKILAIEKSRNFHTVLIYDFTHLWVRPPSCKLCMWIGTPCWHRQFERPMYFFAFHKIPKTLNSS